VARTPQDAAKLRALILGEIKRLAAADGGRAPGKQTFERTTGITEGQWSGVLWARWSEAIAEAGHQPNVIQPRLDDDKVLLELVEATRHYQRLPTYAEMRLYKRGRPEFPNFKTVSNRFPTKEALAAALRRRATTDDSLSDVLPMLPPEANDEPTAERAGGRGTASSEGWVYLIKSGNHYKIGRGDDLERRVKQIRVALPETGDLVHAIRTDDPAGIEAYWHRRFDASRMNGEWFGLSVADVKAFKRRKFM
jgi:hypothetical protein